MSEKKNEGIQLSDIKPTEIEPTKIEPTDIEPTEIEATKIDPTDIKPTEIEPTKIEPTEIKPTEIKPTDINHLETPNIEPTHIEPTDINKPLKNGSAPKVAEYKKSSAITYFCISIIASLVTLFLGLNFGITFYWGIDVVITLFSYFMFFNELKKMPITQEDLDKWNNQILEKHPNFNKDMLMKMEDTKKLMNRFSYWTHTFKVSFTKVLACAILPAALLCAGAGVVLPVVGVGVDGGSVVGTYISDSKDTSAYTVVQVTAYKFNSDNTYQLGYYDKETQKFTWTKSGTYTQSGSKVTISAGYFIVKNGGKNLQDSEGGYWKRV